MPITGSRISEINTGAAQVFKPYKSEYGAEVAAIGQERKKSQQKREADAYGDLSKINTAGIFFKHQKLFGNKQKELFAWTKENIDAIRKGDADKTIEFQQKLTQLGTDIGLSKNAATGYKDMFDKWAPNQDKYRPDVVDYMHDYTGYDEATGEFEVPDMSKLKSQTDLGADFKSNVLPLFEKAKTEGQISWDNPDGSVSTKKTSELTSEDVNFIVTGRLKDPVVFEQAIYDYTKENPNNPNPSNDDIQAYYYDKYAKPFVKKETFGSKTEGSNKGGGLQIGVGAAKSGKFYYNLAKNEPGTMLFGQEGAGSLPPNQFESERAKDGSVKVIVGRPTGKIRNVGSADHPVLKMEMFVPKTTAASFDMSTETPETNPDKYDRVFVPLTGSETNKAKFQGEYSEDNSVDVDVLYKKIRGDVPKKQTETTVKKGDKKQFKEGWATFNGTKWVLDK